MVSLTRLNGQRLIINALLIETVEETPDTLLTLTTGKKVMVREKADDVILLVQSFLRQIGPFRAAIKTEKEGS